MTAFIKKQITVHFLAHLALEHGMQDTIPTHGGQEGVNTTVVPHEQAPKPPNQQDYFITEDNLEEEKSQLPAKPEEGSDDTPDNGKDHDDGFGGEEHIAQQLAVVLEQSEEDHL